MTSSYAILIFLCVLCQLILSCQGVEYEIPPGSFFDAESKYIVLQIERLGLANRLRTIADWLLLANASNRKLLVCWKPTPDCNIRVQELLDINAIDIFPYDLPFGTDGERIMYQIAMNHNRTYGQLNPTGFALPRSELIGVSTDVLFTNYDGIINLKGVRCQHYLYQRSKFYQSLKPKQYIQDMVNEIRSTYFRSSLMVGIHYRAHDLNHDWEVVPPTNGGATALKFGEGATIDDFSNVMTKITNKLSPANVDVTNPVVKFFIASNSEVAKDMFVERFPDNSVAIGGQQNNRETNEGMILAMVEWLLLSQCALIVNTYGSTFAIEAAQMFMPPLVGVLGGQLVTTSDIRLPYCGHMQFLKTQANQGVERTFTEGTADKREVDSHAITLADCGLNMIRDWGLDTVYCNMNDEEAAKYEIV